jgi:hypothetical protein
LRRLAAALAAALLTAAHGPSLAQAPSRFAFGVFGDTPYLPGEEFVVAAMIGEMNEAGLAFVVHVGDLKAGWTPCTDALMEERFALLQRVRVPLVVLPGDNDWVDCSRESAGGYDPVERLEKFRALFHAGESSLGATPMVLERQSSDPRYADYREHVRWTLGDALFVGLNVTGTNNNRRPSAEAEYRRRSDAVNAWLAESFAIASSQRVRGVVVFFQGNPGLDGKPLPRGWQDGYAEFRAQLAARARDFGGPVLIVHGDTHRFRVDRPLTDPVSNSTLHNVTRVEVFGAPLNGWVHVGVESSSPRVFEIRDEPYRTKTE